MRAFRLSVIIDTREQTPWAFPDELVVSRRGTLGAGDYALDGDGVFAIERKSMDDFLGTIASGWERFQRELERMAGHAARVVVVEGDVTRIVYGEHNHPKISTKFAFKRVAQLTLAGVSVLFADNPATAAGLAYSILRERSNETGIGMVGGGSRTGEAEPGVAVPEAGQPLDDTPCVPKGIAPKRYRERRGQVRAAPRGQPAYGGDVEDLGF